MRKIFWVDLEMTGLDPTRHVIIEFASIITDWELNILESMEQVVYQPPEELAKMDSWCVQTHGESGLITKIPHGIPIEQLEQTLIKRLPEIFGDERPMLAGNSIHQDRKFIDRHMPHLSKMLHYRMLDVSAWKIVFSNKFGKVYSKKGGHRALGDIQDSIEELKYYLGYIQMEDPKVEA